MSKDREEQEAAASSLRRVVAGGASADELLDFPVLKEPPKRDQSMFSNPTAKIELIAALVDAGTPECRKRLRSWVKGGHVHFSQLEDVLRVFQDGPSASELRAVRSIVRSVFDTNARLALIKFLRQDDDPATSKILVNMISGASETVGKAAFLAVWGQHNKFARDAGARLASTYPEFLPE